MSRIPRSLVSQLESIAVPYLAEAETLFTQKQKLTRTNSGKWHEMVYCILAGTQFPVKKLKPLFAKLVSGHLELLNMRVVSQQAGEFELAAFLRQGGYRYYNQKAATIARAARFFLEKYRGKVSYFLSTSDNVDTLRSTLVEGIGGVGFKIASHWLRNVGVEICTVDIHLRRLFANLGMDVTTDEGDLDRVTFVQLEKIFHRVAKRFNKPVGVIQYSIWRYSVERCAETRCGICELRRTCVLGKSEMLNPTQMELWLP